MGKIIGVTSGIGCACLCQLPSVLSSSTQTQMEAYRIHSVLLMSVCLGLTACDRQLLKNKCVFHG